MHTGMPHCTQHTWIISTRQLKVNTHILQKLKFASLENVVVAREWFEKEGVWEYQEETTKYESVAKGPELVTVGVTRAFGLDL